MTDLVMLMSKLVGTNGDILIPGVDEMVSGPTVEERSASLVLSSWLAEFTWR